eukprot:3970532-Amphidinium_carterae.1
MGRHHPVAGCLVADHWRLHFVDTRGSGEVYLVVCVHACVWKAARGFQRRHATQMASAGLGALPVQAMAAPPLRKLPWLHALQSLAGRKVYSLWFAICLLTSAPGVLYSVVKAVPGFLQMQPVWSWVVGTAVALVSGLMTGFGLEYLAGKVSRCQAHAAMLQVVGLMVASILLPGLIESHASHRSRATNSREPLSRRMNMKKRATRNPQ